MTSAFSGAFEAVRKTYARPAVRISQSKRTFNEQPNSFLRQLISTSDYLHESIYHSKTNLTLFLDLRKAIEAVDHSVLMIVRVWRERVIWWLIRILPVFEQAESNLTL